MSGLGAASPLGFLAVAIGAVLGAWLRWLAALALNHLSPTVPLGTLLANVVGGLIIGLAVSFFARHNVDKRAKNWGDDANPSAGYIAWLLWRGEAGRKWAEREKD